LCRSCCTVLPATSAQLLHIFILAQSKHWFYTLNNPDETDEAWASKVDGFGCVWHVFQRERGESGTPHFQGTISFEKRKRLTQLKQLDIRAHWETRRGSVVDARSYCTKDEGRISGPIERGQAPVDQGQRTDLSAMARVVREQGLATLAQSDPTAVIRYGRGLQLYASLLPVAQSGTPREVILLFGPPGCGKTRTFFDIEGSEAPLIDASSGVWFDGYMGQSSVCLDDFDGSRSKWPLSKVLNILDRYTRKVPVKGGFVNWTPLRVYVSTNFHPTDWYEWVGREQQFPALQRRFTSVVWWKSLDVPSVTLRSGSDAWSRFWGGRELVQRQLDVADGRLVSRAPNMDYYDF